MTRPAEAKFTRYHVGGGDLATALLEAHEFIKSMPSRQQIFDTESVVVSECDGEWWVAIYVIDRDASP